MPASLLGQLITFSVQVDYDPTPTTPGQKFVKVNVRRPNDTAQSIAARLGQPADARAIASLNSLRSTYQKIKTPTVRVPQRLRPENVVSILAGQEPPKITDGYAKFDVIDRFSRTGITQFTGYAPLTMTVPLAFEALSSLAGLGGQGPAGPRPVAAPEGVAKAAQDAQRAAAQFIETQIKLLERMAGRGGFTGAGIGPPPVVRVTTTDAQGNTVHLIPAAYQWTKSAAGPLWRVAGLAWDDGAIRDDFGNRVRASCVVTLQEHTHTSLVSQSAAARAGAP